MRSGRNQKTSLRDQSKRSLFTSMSQQGHQLALAMRLSLLEDSLDPASGGLPGDAECISGVCERTAARENSCKARFCRGESEGAAENLPLVPARPCHLAEKQQSASANERRLRRAVDGQDPDHERGSVLPPDDDRGRAQGLAFAKPLQAVDHPSVFGCGMPVTKHQPPAGEWMEVSNSRCAVAFA